LPDTSQCITTGTGQRYDPETETLIPTIGGGFDVAHALTGEGFDASEDGTGSGTPLVPIAFSAKDHANAGVMPAVAFNWQGGGTQTTLGYDADSRVSGSLSVGQVPAVAGMQVRRLTPVECLRLQGYSDYYLDVTYRGKPAADGPKYKAIGNSWAVPVVRWIGERIEQVEAVATQLEAA
jgi:DNA (cytosine-5)-methyltransferase 1